MCTSRISDDCVSCRYWRYTVFNSLFSLSPSLYCYQSSDSYLSSNFLLKFELWIIDLSWTVQCTRASRSSRAVLSFSAPNYMIRFNTFFYPLIRSTHFVFSSNLFHGDLISGVLFGTSSLVLLSATHSHFKRLYVIFCPSVYIVRWLPYSIMLQTYVSNKLFHTRTLMFFEVNRSPFFNIFYQKLF